MAGTNVQHILIIEKSSDQIRPNDFDLSQLFALLVICLPSFNHKNLRAKKPIDFFSKKNLNK